MNFMKPPIKEPLFISGTVLSPVWVKWFNELFAVAQVDNSTLLTMRTEQKESSTTEGSSSLLNFIPKANDQSSNSSLESLGADLVMSLIPKNKDQSTNDSAENIGVDLAMSLVSKSEDKSTFEFVNMQTLYWMGV